MKEQWCHNSQPQRKQKKRNKQSRRYALQNEEEPPREAPHMYKNVILVLELLDAYGDC